MGRGAWWATAHKAAKSQMWLKQLSMHMLFIYLFNKYFLNTYGVSGSVYVLELQRIWEHFVYSILLTPS